MTENFRSCVVRVARVKNNYLIKIKRMNKKILVGVVSLATLGIMGAGLYANAYQGDPNTRAPWFSQERHDAMQKAFENNDYNAWKNLSQENNNARVGWKFSKVTPENFPRFSEMHRLMKEGKFDEASRIRAELGLGNRGGKGNCAYPKGSVN
jgi:hypothetical protein